MRYILCGALLLLATTASAYDKGERVLGRFGNMDYWYPATIAGVEGGQFTLSYDDGSNETVPKAQLRPIVWKKGQRIECQFETSDWLRAQLTESNATDLTGLLEDGSTKSAAVTRCRTDNPPEDPEAAAAEAAAAKAMTDQLNRPKKRVDETKVDCNKADEISAQDEAAYNDNPLGAIMNKADTMCTYVQHVYQKAKPGKSLPARSAYKGVSADDIAYVAGGFWAGSNDAEFVQVVGKGRVIGSGWKELYNSDVKGVPVARQLGVAHGITYKGACYVVYGHLRQENSNHPNPLVPPSWTASIYQPSDYEPPEKLDCKVVKGM